MNGTRTWPRLCNKVWLSFCINNTIFANLPGLPCTEALSRIRRRLASRRSSSSSVRVPSCFLTRVRCKLLYRSACLSFRHAKNAAFWPSLLRSNFRSKHRVPAMLPRSLLCALISWSSASVMTWAWSRSKSTSLIWRWSLRSRMLFLRSSDAIPASVKLIIEIEGIKLIGSMASPVSMFVVSLYAQHSCRGNQLRMQGGLMTKKLARTKWEIC